MTPVTFLDELHLKVGDHVLAPTAWELVLRPVPADIGPPTWPAGDFNAGRNPSSTFFVYLYNGRPHLGIDIGGRADKGRPITAPVQAVVVRASSNPISGAGRHVLLCGNVEGVPTYFYSIHLNRVDVKVGQLVQAGQQIGTLGGSGFGSLFGYTPHYHGEIWQWIEKPRRNGSDGVHIDPGLIYFDKPSGKKGHPAMTRRSRTIKEQGRLNQLGFPLAIDGDDGPKTHSASMAALAELEQLRQGTGTALAQGIPEGDYIGPDDVGVEIRRVSA